MQRNLQPGDKMPSKRSFAKNLGISVITVENAYAQLVAEGYLYSIPKSGFYVADIRQPEYAKGAAPAEVNRSDAAEMSATAGMLKAAETPEPTEREVEYVADFRSNGTDEQNFPFSIWNRLVREVLNDRQKELMTNAPSGGIAQLRNAIAGHLKAFRNMEVDPARIIVGAGTEYLYSLLIQLLGFEKVYAIEDPGYHKLAKIYEKHNVKYCYIPMDASGVSVKALERSCASVAHISPSHHFPTGIVMPISRRYELLGWAARSEERYIIEDDYDSEFRMNGKILPSMLDIDLSGKVIYMNTFHKTLSSTVRISYMILPQKLMEKFYRELSFYSCTVSNFEQYTLAKFIEDGYFEKHINRMRNYYHGKRDLLLETIYRSKLKDYITIYEEDAGLHFIMEIKTELSDEMFCKLALKQGINIAPLSRFYAQETGQEEHKFIINYSALKEERMEEAIRILYEIAR
jgi:GntR family transcriptional regulator/MocR family aminotransferase